MPVSWGSSPAYESSADDLRQYVKFFDNLGYDFDIRRQAGRWHVTVWGKRPITPIKIKNVKVEDERGYHYEESTISHLKEFVAASEPRLTLNEALLDVYRAVRAKK